MKITEKLCKECGKPVVFVIRNKMRFEMCIDPNCPTKEKWKKRSEEKKKAEEKAATEKKTVEKASTKKKTVKKKTTRKKKGGKK